MGERADRDQVGCPRCDFLATEVMRLREDRNDWRQMYTTLRKLVNALLDVLSERPPPKCPLCVQEGLPPDKSGAVLPCDNPRSP